MRKMLELQALDSDKGNVQTWKVEVTLDSILKRGICVDCEAISGEKKTKSLVVKSRKIWGNNRVWEEPEFRCLQCDKTFLNDWDFFNLFITEWAKVEIKNPLALEELRKEINYYL